MAGPERGRPWPGWERLPGPLRDLGVEALAKHAAELVQAAEREERGEGGFHELLLHTVRGLVERRLGSGAAARLQRVKPLVEAFGYDASFTTEAPGKGERRLINYVKGLEPEQPFHSPADFPWCETLAAHTADILRELKEHQDLAPEWVAAPPGTWGTMDAPEWRALGLVQCGSWVMEDRFPRTREILNSLPGCIPDEVMFARMPPGTQIGAHSDNMNFLLVAHLGLELEEGLCSLRVGELSQSWSEGKVLVFDHTYVHSAANESRSDRVVFICRFWHPGLAEEERYAIQLLMQLMAAMQRHALEQ